MNTSTFYGFGISVGGRHHGHPAGTINYPGGLQAADAKPQRAGLEKNQPNPVRPETQTDSTVGQQSNAGHGDKQNGQDPILASQRGPVGRDVRNNDGEVVGEIDNVLADIDGEEIQAVVSVGGFWGIGDEEIIVPLDKLNLNCKRAYVYFNGTEKELKSFPQYRQPARRPANSDVAYRERRYVGPPVAYPYDPYFDGDRRGRGAHARADGIITTTSVPVACLTGAGSIR